MKGTMNKNTGPRQSRRPFLISESNSNSNSSSSSDDNSSIIDRTRRQDPARAGGDL